MAYYRTHIFIIKIQKTWENNTLSRNLLLNLHKHWAHLQILTMRINSNTVLIYPKLVIKRQRGHIIKNDCVQCKQKCPIMCSDCNKYICEGICNIQLHNDMLKIVENHKW